MNCRLLIVAATAALLTVPTRSGAETSNTKSIEGTVHALRPNELLDRSLPAVVDVYVDIDGAAYIRTDTLLNPRGYLGPADVPAFQAALTKALEWSEIARTNAAEVKKELGSWMRAGEADSEFGIELDFVAFNGGKNSGVWLTVKDFDNMFSNDKVYLDVSDVRAFQAICAKIPQTVADLKKEIQNRALFK